MSAEEPAPFDESGPRSKKRRFLDPSPFDLSKDSAQGRFLGFHFEVLQSLYGTDEVDASVWTVTKGFLKHRGGLMEAKKEAELMLRIQKESVRFTGEEESATLKLATQSLGTSHSTRQKPSPVHSRYPSLSQASVDLTSHRQSRNHFHIVTRLLGCRRNLVANEFAQLAKPYQPLLAAAESRVAELQKQLSESLQLECSHAQRQVQDLLAANIYKQKRKAADLKSTQDSGERSKLAEMECKMRLWSLLALDLKEAISANA